MWNGSWCLRNSSMVLGSHGNMLLGLPFKNRTCLQVQLDNCLQTQYIKICSNIPSKATFLPASPQSISQHSSTIGAWSFLLNESSSNKQSLLWSALGWLRLCQLHITAWNSANSASQMCMMVWRLSLLNSFPPCLCFTGITSIHFSHFNSISGTTTWKIQIDGTEFIRAQASAESNCLGLYPALLITSGCWTGCLISLNLSYFISKMGIITVPTSQVWAFKII